MLSRPLLRQYRLWTILLVALPCLVIMTIYSFVQIQSAKEAAPIPRAAPVITATSFLNLIIIILLIVCYIATWKTANPSTLNE